MKGKDIGGVCDNKLGIRARVVAEAAVARHKYSVPNLQRYRCIFMKFKEFGPKILAQN